MSDKRLKALETEIAYLRKEIEKSNLIKPIELHYHYTYDLHQIKDVINYFKKKLEEK